MPPQIENNVPPINPVPPELPRKHKKLIWLVSILILVGILTSGYLFYITRTGCCDILRNQNLTVATSTDQFADWKTYRNEEYGFEVNYPPTWTTSLEKTTVWFDRNDINEDEKAAREIGYPLSISIKTTDFKNIKDWFENKFKDRVNEIAAIKPQIKSLKIAGEEALNYTDPISMGGCDENFSFIHDSTVFDIYRHGSTCTYSDELFDQILSTFKFISTSTPTTIDTSNWKTYKNEEYGFEVKYPEGLSVSEDKEATFSTITIGGNLLHIGVENKLIKEVDACIQKEDTTNIGAQTADWCLDGNPDDRWISFINQETPPVGVVFYCWFPLTQNNKSVCNNILSTFKFTKIEK